MTALERHERIRWEQMNEPQLARRLEAISTPKKLAMFAKIAREFGCIRLRREALDKLNFFKELGTE